jgi:acetyl esterase/lipase
MRRRWNSDNEAHRKRGHRIDALKPVKWSRVRQYYRFVGLVIAIGAAGARGEEHSVLTDIEYARVQNTSLRLDLYKTPREQKGPLIVYIHGGAWRGGSKKEMPLKELVLDGCPVASVDYRLSTAARFPAQVHDIKAAIRFLRGRQGELGIDPSRVVVAGSSAGGHLAALVGVTNGESELEGMGGKFTKESSSVQGIISFFGAANLTTILAQSTPHGLSVRVPALELLLGGQPDAKVELARLASPVFHVDNSDPPLLLIHGDQDAQMPVNQALELQGAYEAAGCKVGLEIIHGAGHGGGEFYDEKRMVMIKKFLNDLAR